jgi:hypothetical protein
MQDHAMLGAYQFSIIELPVYSALEMSKRSLLGVLGHFSFELAQAHHQFCIRDLVCWLSEKLFVAVREDSVSWNRSYKKAGGTKTIPA